MTENQQILFYSLLAIVLFMMILSFRTEGLCLCSKGGIRRIGASREKIEQDVSQCNYPDHFAGVL